MGGEAREKGGREKLAVRITEVGRRSRQLLAKGMRRGMGGGADNYFLFLSFFFQLNNLKQIDVDRSRVRHSRYIIKYTIRINFIKLSC